jgi:ABC-2 type transport system ATP-binding protein
MDAAILTTELSRNFGTKIAVRELTLQVEQGEVFGFLGPNGAGKTTTVRLLNGVLDANAGSAQVLGFDLATQANEIRRRTGVLTETPNLYEALTARENLAFYGDLYGVAEEETPRRVNQLLEDFSLAARGDDRVGSYSKGMRQRLAIARALLHEPNLLFLDEPTASLDPAAARRVTETIQELSRGGGRTVFLCTHNLAEAQRLCDRVGVIDQGVLRAIGTPSELASKLWHGLWVEFDLHGDASPQVLEILQHIPSVLQHSMQDGKLALELKGEEDVPDVVTAISAAGGRIYSVEHREHTLEDIYFEIQNEVHRHAESEA